MKKIISVYLAVFAILCISFLFVRKAYQEWSEYTDLIQRANQVLIIYEELDLQISNATMIIPELLSAKNSNGISMFSVDKAAILININTLNGLVRDSVNIQIAKQLDDKLHHEIDWILKSNVPDSILHNRAGRHIMALEEINRLMQSGLKRTKFVINYRQQHLSESFNRLAAMTLIFLILVLSLLIYNLLRFFNQRVKTEKKEDQLIEKEIQFRYFLDNMLEGVQIHDFNWRYTYVNDTLASYSKCRKEDLVGFTLMEKYPGIEQSELFKTFAKCMEDRIARQTETEFIFPDGTRSDFEISIQPVPEGLFILSIDKTEQKKAKNKLQESIKDLTDLKFALDESAIVAVTDQRGIISHVNDKFCKISGYGPSELIGQDHRVINSGFHDKAFIKNLWVTIANGKIWKGELKNRTKDGTFYWVDTTIIPFLDKDGKPYQYYAIRSDITDRKNTEEKIKAGEARYKNVMDTIHESLIIEDLEGKMVYANSEFIKTFGFSEEELSTLTLKDYTSEESYNEIMTRHNNRVQGAPVEDEFVYKAKRKDGTEIWIEARVSLLIENGKIIGTQSLERDITERITAEEKIKKTNRMFAFLSAINQSIVHSGSEKELLDITCITATSIGQFKLAYIGLLEGEHRLNIASLSGDKAGMEKVLAMTDSGMNDPIHGDQDGISEAGGLTGIDYTEPLAIETPVGKALRSGLHEVNNDMCNDPALIGLKEVLARVNVRSAISLPIRRFGEMIGAFNLFSSEQHFFDTQEIALLVEAAGDISFALENFEKSRLHKETEDLLQKSDRRFRGMIEKSADFKTLTDKNGRITYGSPSVLAFFGYTNEELLNKQAMSFFHPDDVTDLISKRNTILDKPGASYQFEYRISHKNGNWFWCEGTVTNFLHEPAIQGLVSNFRDISKIKIAEEQKAFDSQNLDALINNTNDLLWSIDKNFRLITFNRPFYETVKMATGKALSKGDGVFSVVLSDEQEKRFRKFYKRAFKGEIFTVTDVVEGDFVYAAEISFYPIRQGDEIIGTACYSRNVSERMKQEKEREYMIKQLTTNNHDLRQFAYITSHNLRGPIANLLGLTNLLDTLKIKDPTMVRILSGIKTATVMFDETIKDLAHVLTLRDNPNIQIEMIAFEPVFQKVKDLCEISLADCQAEISFDFKETPKVNFSKPYLESIFMNLLTNSVKYQNDSRRLKITINTWLENGQITLRFSDNGIGFDSELQKEKTFQLYQRFHTHKEGKGLGLFLIKSQLNALGGSIEVQSRPGAGTIFTIKFAATTKI